MGEMAGGCEARNPGPAKKKAAYAIQKRSAQKADGAASNRSALQPKTLGFALRFAGRARCWRSARQPAVLQPLPAMAAVCGRLDRRGHPLAVVVTRSVKSATLGRKGVFRSSRRSSSDWSGRLPAWAKAGLRSQPHASQRGVLVLFISQGESGR